MSLIRLFAFLSLQRKTVESLYNRNIAPTKKVKVVSALYKENVVYQNPIKNQNYLNDSGATKLV